MVSSSSDSNNGIITNNIENTTKQITTAAECLVHQEKEEPSISI